MEAYFAGRYRVAIETNMSLSPRLDELLALRHCWHN